MIRGQTEVNNVVFIHLLDSVCYALKMQRALKEHFC